MNTLEMPEDYALVLQQVDEHGEDDFTNLAESLSLDSRRLTHVIQALRNKGLLYITTTTQGMWIRLSTKGQRFMMSMWPESGLQHSM